MEAAAVNGISEKPVSPDTLLSIKRCAKTGLRILGIEPRASMPSAIVAGVDRFVRQWQKGIRPAEAVLSAEDAPMIIGCLWAEALVSRFKWEWSMVRFADAGQIIAPAVLAADRSLVIYPLHFLTCCFADPAADVAILRAYNLLKAGAIPNARPRAYLDLMREVGERQLAK